MEEDEGLVTLTEALKAKNVRLDPMQIQYAINQMRNEQNLLAGILSGAAGALLGAGIWAAITVFTHFQIGWMAVGVGFLVGLAIRTFGRGIDPVFGIAGAVLALLGCCLGNILAICGEIAGESNLGITQVLLQLNPGNAFKLMLATFDFRDLIFYGIAVYEGYRLSIRRITVEDIAPQIPGDSTHAT
jgi:hypothetical protein